MAKKKENKHLYYLDELSDYKIASDDPDVRGWDVRDSNNRMIGKVDNLLVSKKREQVVYLDVEVDKTIIDANHDPYGTPANADVHEFINKEGQNHIIIPIGLVSLNTEDNFVYTDRINHETFAETKRIEKGTSVNRDYEVVVLESYDRDNRNGDNSRRTRENKEPNSQTTKRTREEDLERDDQRRIDEERERDAAYREEERRRKRVDTDSDQIFDEEDQDSEKRNERRGIDEDRPKKGRIPDDDSFYERKEFDRTRYRKDDI